MLLSKDAKILLFHTLFNFLNPIIMAKFILLNCMVNKHLYTGVFMALFLLWSCKGEVKQSGEKGRPKQETVLSDLIKSTVLVEDTSFNYMLRKDSSYTNIYRSKDSSSFKALVKNIIYLPAVTFENYTSGLFSFLKSDSGIIADKNLSVLRDAYSKRSIYVLCDSIMFLDEPGKPTRWMCDSTSTFRFIQGFDFYESWSIDKINGNIKKVVLAYAPVKYNDVKKQFVPIFYVFKSREIFEKIKDKIK
jgi:hypothetical protein